MNNVYKAKGDGVIPITLKIYFHTACPAFAGDKTDLPTGRQVG